MISIHILTMLQSHEQGWISIQEHPAQLIADALRARLLSVRSHPDNRPGYVLKLTRAALKKVKK